MKYIIIAIALITTFNLNAQNNFTLNEGKVTWQKVYETKKPEEEIISHFKSSGLFKLFRVEEGNIIATLKPQSIDKDDKKIAGTLPPALTVKAKYAGTVFIDFQKNKYRVIYSDILIIGNGELIKKGAKQPFEKHYVNKDGKAFRISFNKKPKTIYNAAFNQTFQIEVVKSDDW